MWHDGEKQMIVKIRKFARDDIALKVEWINNPKNNKYLHYDIPICIEKTETWVDKNLYRNDRYDGVIEADNIPVGLIGLLSIDAKKREAEYYIMLDNNYRSRGIAEEASRQIINYGFYNLGLTRIYLYTETQNIPAQRLFEKIGFKQEACLKNNIVSHGKLVDRYAYAILKDDWKN